MQVQLYSLRLIGSRTEICKSLSNGTLLVQKKETDHILKKILLIIWLSKIIAKKGCSVLDNSSLQKLYYLCNRGSLALKML